MSRRALWPALLLPLLLTACPGQDLPETPPETQSCRALAAATTGLLVQSWPRTQTTPNWTAPRRAGQVLILTGTASGQNSHALSPHALSPQALSPHALEALSGVQTQAILPGLQVAQTPAGESDQAFAQRLGAAGLRTQPNYLYRALAVPNDPAVPGNAGLNIAGVQVFQNYLTRIGAPAAWGVLRDAGRSPAWARVAVLDSAPDRSHPELQGRLSAAVSCLSLRPNAPVVTATSEHGSEVTGLIGANTNNGKGIAGLTWSGPLLGIEVLDENGDGSTADVAAGLNYAVQQGAAIINMSLGGPRAGGDTVLDAALSAAARSAVLVAAAGNTAGEGVYYPASHPDVIAVGSVGSVDGALACYSARPSAARPRALDIVAPGGFGSICAGYKAELDLPVLASGGGYRLEAGTSFSAPMVSGVAALMRGANPNLSAAQTRALLLGSVRRSGGLPLLDAEAAVRAALR